MISAKEQRVSSPLTSELAVDERERRLQRRRERERARVTLRQQNKGTVEKTANEGQG